MDDNPLQSFIDGDDVDILVGLVGFGSPEKPIITACIIVDYQAIKDAKLRESYTRTIDSMWEDNSLKDGLNLLYTDKTTVRVESKRMSMAMSIGSEVQQVVAPFYHVEIECGEDTIREFEGRKNQTGMWVLHLRTDEYSYLMCIDKDQGTIISKFKREPLEIAEN